MEPTQTRRRESSSGAKLRHLPDDGLYRAILESLPDGVLVAGPRGKVVCANPQAEALLGYPRGELVGSSIEQLIVERPGGESGARPATGLLDRSPTSPPLMARRRDGGEARVEVGLRRLAPPHGQLTLVVLSEAPERLRVEQAQREQELRELERLRAEWNSLVAHDLRQPLNHITIFAQLLSRQPVDWTPQAREAIAQIKQMTVRLSRMTFDLLDLSRLEVGRLPLERRPVDLFWLARECVQRAQLETPGRPFELRVHGALPSIDGDPDRLAQVLENLLSNAVTYGFAGTPIDVELRRQGDTVELSVSNQGKGIAPSDIGLLFERFGRARAGKQSRVKSIGLGLSIARGLVEAHGGHVGAHSVPGGKTTFWLRLPIDRR